MSKSFNASKGKVRRSNFELLRIVSMLLVLLAHYVPTRGGVTKDALLNDTFATLCTLEYCLCKLLCSDFRIFWNTVKYQVV